MRNLTFALPFLCLLFAHLPLGLKSQSFLQDFQSSRNVADYIGTGPNLFNAIETSGSGTQVSINGFALDFTRAANNAGMFLRRGLGPWPAMKFTLDLKAENVSTSATSAAILRVGEGFSDDYLAPPNTSTHSRIGINLVNQTGSAFELRDISTGQNSPSFTGIRTISWWINHSGSIISYLSPSGTTETLGNDRSDIWIDNLQAFNEMAAASSSNLSDFKMIFSQGSGKLQFDNFSITPLGPLPVGLMSFDCSSMDGHCNSLSWCTGYERGHDYFEVQRSRDGVGFHGIARVPGKGERTEPACYRHEDCETSEGDAYYRLKIVADDGSLEYSKVLAILGKPEGMPALRTNIVRDDLQLLFPSATREEISLAVWDLSGRLHLVAKVGIGADSNRVDVSGLPAGNYFLLLDKPGMKKAFMFLKQG